ncbi:hypothetical protein GCM10027174_28800 [Salinifilum aidingensis]
MVALGAGGADEEEGWMLRRHWLLGLLLLAGLALRVVAQLAYQPALLYIDSFRYLNDLGVFFPGGINPIGYEVLLLGPVLLVGDLAGVVAVQHLLGLALGAGIYALLRRHGVRTWLAAAAAAPVLLDAYQLQLEQMVMSDLLFQVLLLLAVYVLTWWGTPGPRLAALAGVVLAVSMIVRIVGITLVVPAVVFVVLAAGLRPADGWGRRLRAGGALVLGFVLVVGGYGVYHLAWTGLFAFGGGTGNVVYGRTAVVARCEQLDLTPREQVLCPDESVPERRARGIDYYIHHYKPVEEFHSAPGAESLVQAQGTFARKVLLHQPGDVIYGAAHDFLKGFAPLRTQVPGDVPLERWHFQAEYPMYGEEWYVAEWVEVAGGGPITADPGLAAFLRGYQLNGGYTPGILLGGMGVLAVVAVCGAGAARGSGLRGACLLTAGLAVTVVGTAAGMEFSWRYQLPGLVLLPLAGAFALTAVTGYRDPRGSGAPTTAVGSAEGERDA